jgi:hypothetical protein
MAIHLSNPYYILRSERKMLKTSAGSTDEGLIEKAELVMAIRGYGDEEKQRWDDGIDLIASHSESDDKMLLRIITEPNSKSGVVGVDAIRNIRADLPLEDYDKVVLIGRSFTRAAEEELRRGDIEIISEKSMPYFRLEKLYATILGCIDDLCQTKCGHIPKKASDCKGYSEGYYSCKVRLISDDASFHLERGWRKLLQNDLKRLLAIGKSLNDQKLEK